MKRIILLLAVTLLTASSFSQVQDTVLIKVRENLLLLSRRQKSTAITMLVSGSTMMVAGLVLIDQRDKKNSNSPLYDLASFVFYAGVTVDLISIPFFISSAKNTRRAASIGLGNLPLLFPQHNTLITRVVPVISFKISF